MNQDVLAKDDNAERNAAATPGGRGAALKPIPDDALILIPMRNTVLFPGVISPITVGRKVSVAAAQEAVRSEKRIGYIDVSEYGLEGRRTCGPTRTTRPAFAIPPSSCCSATRPL